MIQFLDEKRNNILQAKLASVYNTGLDKNHWLFKWKWSTQAD